MALPDAAIVCGGAALLVVLAHGVVYYARYIREDESDSALLEWFGLGVCALAFGAVVGRLIEATQLVDALLLLGTAAGIMAAAVPLLPAFGPLRREARRRSTGESRRGAGRGPGRAGRSRARSWRMPPARKGRRVLPPTPFAPPASGRRPPSPGPSATPRPPAQPPAAAHPHASEHPQQPESVSIPAAGHAGARREPPRPAWADAVTEPIPRLRLGDDPPFAAPAPPATARVEERAAATPTAGGSPLSRPVQQATETLEHLDKVVEDIAGALRLGPPPTP